MPNVMGELTPSEVRENAQRDAMQFADDTLSRWLAHQYSHQEQFRVLRKARDRLRSALKK